MPTIQSRNFSTETLIEASSRFCVWLITIDSEGFTEPYHFCSDGDTVLGYDPNTSEPVYGFVSSGTQYIVYPFSLTLPESGNGQHVPKAILRIANSMPDFSAYLQTLKVDIKFYSKIVFFDDPDNPIDERPSFLLSEIEISSSSITGTLTVEHFFDVAIPSKKLTRSHYPGAFTG